MKVACVQQKAQGVECFREILPNLTKLIEEAAENGAELIVLPECAYPAYFLGLDEDACEQALEQSGAFLDGVARLAKKHGVHIATGVALREDGVLRNSAYLYDDAGTLIGKAAKSNMWHFDGRWFTPGEEFCAVDTRFGRVGLMVCADGRVPEIARILSLQGATIIIDTVNLVAAAENVKALTNQQYEFILPVRAMENRAWILVADKAGVEAKTAEYLGRSMVIDPDGTIVVDASTDQQEIIYCDVDPNAGGGLRYPRKPALYGSLVQELEEQPAYQIMRESVRSLEETEVYVAVAAFRAETGAEYLARAKFYIHACSLMGAKLLVLPQLAGEDGIEAVARELKDALKEEMVVVVSGKSRGSKCAAVFDRTADYGTFYKTHGSDADAEAALSVVQTPYGRFGFVFDEEPYIPEIPRVLMVNGCDLMIWCDDTARPMNKKVMQTRGAENKIFVVRTSNAANDTSSVVNPDGRPVTTTLTGNDQAAGGIVFLPLARAKTVIPGTHIVTGRIPRAYHRLLEV